MLQYEKGDVSERSDINKTCLTKECELYYYWFFEDVEFNLKNMFVIDVMIY